MSRAVDYGITRREMASFREAFANFEERHGKRRPRGSFHDRQEASFFARLCGTEAAAVAALRFRQPAELAEVSGARFP